MKKHSLTGSSNAHIWWYCPGSVHLCAVVPVEETKAMRDGTAMHLAAEELLRDKPQTVKLTRGQQETVNAYVDWAKRERVLFKEYRAIAGSYPDAFGTADLIRAAKERIEIVDFKTGKRPVTAYGNEQLLTLAVFYGLANYRLTIWQDGRADTWDPCDEDLSRAKGIIEQRLFEIYLSDETPPLIVGDHCERCRACSFCPKRAEAMKAKADAWLEDDNAAQ